MNQMVIIKLSHQKRQVQPQLKTCKYKRIPGSCPNKRRQEENQPEINFSKHKLNYEKNNPDIP